MPRSDLIIRIAGDGGEGIISCGDFITTAAARSGLDIFTFKTFPAEIRGGYAMYQLRASTEKIHNQGDTFDVFCALNSEAYEINKSHLWPGTAFVHDDTFDPSADLPEGVHAYPIPMTQTAKNLGFKKAKNMVALGAMSQLFSIPADSLKDVVKTTFKNRGEKIVQSNLDAFNEGARLASNLKKTDPWRLASPSEPKDVVVLSGSQAIGLGALIAGLDFFSAYPITPASEIARYLAIHLPKTGGSLIQAEDEIAAISQVLGASYAGKKAMTATSGPGLSLMNEMLGMAFMSETPIVVVDVQRGGPSTGLPTKHEQSDLFAAVHGSHGDSGRIVLSVENVADCVATTVDAMNLAETYQCPVILLSDGSVAFSTQTIPTPDPGDFTIADRKRWDGEGEYKRYKITEDCISPMVDPGTPGGLHVTTGLEHDETGAPSYAPFNHKAMSGKRFDKLTPLAQEYRPVEIDGDWVDQADIGIIAWGSTIGIVREVIYRLRYEGIRIKGFYPKLMWPMPVAQYEAFAKSCEKILVAEVNHQGQLAHFIRAETSLNPISHTTCRGIPFTPEKLVNKVRELL